MASRAADVLPYEQKRDADLKPHLSVADYNQLFKSLSGRFIVFAASDPDFTIVEQSLAHANVALVKRENVIGKPLLTAFPDTSDEFRKTGKSQLIESLRRVMRTGQPDEMPLLRYDLRDETGQLNKKTWSVTHYPVFDADKRLKLIFQATEEVTAKLQLAEAQRRLEEALANGNIGAWSWDITKDKVIADKNLSRMFGLDPAEGASGLPLPTFVASIHELDRERVSAEIRRAIDKRERYETEYRTVSTDGSSRWVIARGKVEYGPDGKPLSFPGTLVDITDRKVAENNLAFLAKASIALSASLDYKKTLRNVAKLMVPEIADWCSVHIINDDNCLEQVVMAHKDPAKVRWARQLEQRQGPVALTDKQSSVARVVRRGEAEIYPFITEEMLAATTTDPQQLKLLRGLGLSSVIAVPIKRGEQTVGAINLISAELKRHYNNSDFEMAKELASRVSLSLTNAQLFEDARRELRLRRRLEEDLRQANEQLENRVVERTKQLNEVNANLARSNEELENFAYVASHDLQEPLRKIQAFGDLLAEEYADQLGDGRDYLVRMRKAAGRMSVLIQDLLAFSRVTTKAKAPVAVDLNKIVAEVLEDLQVRIDDTAGQVTVAKLPTVEADPTQMQQLFQNLIGNALKFHRSGVPPRVDLTVTAPDRQQRVTITVADNGIGFDEKYLDRIFSVFQRLHGRDVYEGTGIGLAVCRKIVERHGGSISASSQPGKGASFKIVLPLKNKEHFNDQR